MLRVRILEEAAQEAIEAATWYEKERAGLGMEFDQALNSALDLLESAVVPLMTMPGTAGASDTERLVLSRFPYDIVVRRLPGEIVVLAIAHQSRRPGYWRRRLRA